MFSSSASIRLLLVFTILFIIYGSLYPGRLDTGGGSFSAAVAILVHSWPQRLSQSYVVDAVLNILIYIPVGFLGALSLARRHRVIRTLAPVLLASFLSASMELLQAFLPGRVTSLLDLVTNTTGAALGVATAWLLADWLGKLWPVCALRLAGQPGAALLLTLWVSAQCFPFLPGIGLYRLHAKWIAVTAIDWNRLPWDALAGFSAWLAAMVVIETLVEDFGRFSFLLPALVVPVRFLIQHQHPTAGDLCGAAAAAFMSRIAPQQLSARKTAAAVILLIAILAGGLAPLTFQTTASPFSWVPFSTSLGLNSWDAAIAVLLAKSFRYGAAVWLLARFGIGFLAGGILVAALLSFIEWMQVYLPGRSAESTDPVLCLLLAAVLKLLHRSHISASSSLSTDSK